MIQERRKRIQKQKEIFILLLSFGFSYLVFFFSPIELLIRNQKDFLTNTEQIILPMLLLSLVLSAAIFLLLNGLLLLHETLYIVVSELLSGIMFAFYIQELFFNGKMVSITGNVSETKLSRAESIVNFLIFYVIALLPLILHVCKKQYPDAKIFHIGGGYLLPYLTGLIFLMQTAGIIGTFAQFGWNKYERIFHTYPSYEPSVSLSRENNITVFLTDTLDTSYMDEVLETYPELYTELDGFTFYQNNLSHYSTTFPSVAHMLTKQVYTGEEWNLYYEKAWSQETFLDELKRNDYQISLFLDNLTTYQSYSDIADRCDNLESVSENAYSFNYFGYTGILRTMIKLSLGKLMPYHLKPLFTDSIKPSFSANFITIHEENPSFMPGAVGYQADLKYYDYLKTVGLTADNNRKTFTFMHLNGMHDASYEVASLYNGETAADTSERISTARGEFEIILEYIRQMKTLGIYDNSAIIILGDHGRPPDELSKEKKTIDSPIVTALLIKPPHAEAAPLLTDASAALSNDCLGASVLEYAGLPHDAYGYSYHDIISSNIQDAREFQAVKFWSFGSMSMAASYQITGDARDFSNWKLMD